MTNINVNDPRIIAQAVPLQSHTTGDTNFLKSVSGALDNPKTSGYTPSPEINTEIQAMTPEAINSMSFPDIVHLFNIGNAASDKSLISKMTATKLSGFSQYLLDTNNYSLISSTLKSMYQLSTDIVIAARRDLINKFLAEGNSHNVASVMYNFEGALLDDFLAAFIPNNAGTNVNFDWERVHDVISKTLRSTVNAKLIDRAVLIGDANDELFMLKGMIQQVGVGNLGRLNILVFCDTISDFVVKASDTTLGGNTTGTHLDAMFNEIVQTNNPNNVIIISTMLSKLTGTMLDNFCDKLITKGDYALIGDILNRIGFIPGEQAVIARNKLEDKVIALNNVANIEKVMNQLDPTTLSEFSSRLTASAIVNGTIVPAKKATLSSLMSRGSFSKWQALITDLVPAGAMTPIQRTLVDQVIAGMVIPVPDPNNIAGRKTTLQQALASN